MKAEQSTIHLVRANLGRWIGPRLPEAVVESAREPLRANDKSQRLLGCLVRVFGDDLHLHSTTFNGHFPPGEDATEFAHTLAKSSALAGLARGEVTGGTSCAAPFLPT